MLRILLWCALLSPARAETGEEVAERAPLAETGALAGKVLGPPARILVDDRPKIEVAGEAVRVGSLKQRVTVDHPADIVLLYGGEQRGELGTCGCEVRPRGGLARVDRYRAALERVEDAPVLLLNPGGYLDTVPDTRGDLRRDVQVRNRYMLDGLALGQWTAANVSYRDLPHQGRAGVSPLGVSANVRPPDGVDLPTHQLVEAGDLTVAVTGVSPLGLRHLQPDGWTFEDPVAALEALVPELEADLVVVLAFEPGDLADKLARVPGVDVLIEAGGYTGRYDPIVEAGAVWVRARDRSEQIGELRLVVQDGRVVSALDRKIDLDQRVGASGSLTRLEKRAVRAVKRALVELYGDLIR